MANGTVKTFPSTGILDIARLIGGLGSAFLRHPFSFSLGEVMSNWIWGQKHRHKSDNFVVNLGFRKILLVTGKELSEHILEKPPSTESFIAGPTKFKGMSFLATEGLTIGQGQTWQRLRTFNEEVLSIESDPILQQSVLDQVHKAFSEPVSSIEDIRRCMGKAMLGIVFGGAPPHLVQDIDVLIGYVQSPVKRMVFGKRQKGRLDRVYSTIEQMWEKNEQPQSPNLIAKACPLTQGGKFESDDLLQQVPHWMFTFTGSGTDLLTRTLVMIGSRSEVGGLVRDEIAASGPLDEPGTIGRLTFLEACILETGRLFPPVTRTIHIAPEGDTFDGTSIQAGMEIWHYFPASCRDTSVDPNANDFDPNKWVFPGMERRSQYSNLFLSGARACPGEGLILFICKAAIAILTEQPRVQLSSTSLANDPVPFSFSNGAIRFHRG